MTLQLTPALEQKLLHMAAQANRTPEELAQEVLDDYLKHIESLTMAVREAEESADRDGWLTQEEVFERINKRLLKTA
jgi:predicted transcriptional regulator